MFNFLKKKPVFDEEKKGAFVNNIAQVLEIQVGVAGFPGIQDAQGEFIPKALGYIYGFVDAALMQIGQNMADSSVGIPITFNVLRRLFPGLEGECVKFLLEYMGKDEQVMLGAMIGGNEFMDLASGKRNFPLGLTDALREAAGNKPD